MCKLFTDNEAAIKDYCYENRLNFEKARKSPKSFNKTECRIQYYDREVGRQELLGLIPPAPAPITLKIFKTDSGLHFEQTEHTAKYLAV